MLNYAPRVTVLLALTLIQTIFATLCIFLSDTFEILLLNDIAIGMADGCLWSIGSIAIREYYGRKYFGRNFGLFTTIISIMAILAQICFGWMYKLVIPFDVQNDCYGKLCYRSTFILHSLMSLISTILFIMVFRNHSTFTFKGLYSLIWNNK